MTSLGTPAWVRVVSYKEPGGAGEEGMSMRMHAHIYCICPRGCLCVPTDDASGPYIVWITNTCASVSADISEDQPSPRHCLWLSVWVHYVQMFVQVGGSG